MYIGKGLNFISIIQFTRWLDIVIHIKLFKLYINKNYLIKLY
jgi:hypothetical protein